MVMMDWLGKMLQLPEAFLMEKGGKGGGVIQVRRGRGRGEQGAAAPRRVLALPLEDEQSRAVGTTGSRCAPGCRLPGRPRAWLSAHGMVAATWQVPGHTNSSAWRSRRVPVASQRAGHPPGVVHVGLPTTA